MRTILCNHITQAFLLDTATHVGQNPRRCLQKCHGRTICNCPATHSQLRRPAQHSLLAAAEEVEMVEREIHQPIQHQHCPQSHTHSFHEQSESVQHHPTARSTNFLSSSNPAHPECPSPPESLHDLPTFSWKCDGKR